MALLNSIIWQHRIDLIFACVRFDDNLSPAWKDDLTVIGDNLKNMSNVSAKAIYRELFKELGKFYHADKMSAERRQASGRVIDGFLMNDEPSLGNHLFHTLWLPWARKAVFVFSNDTCLAASDYGKEAVLLREQQKSTSWAIPSGSVLKYMVERAPSHKITELGAGRGYWAKLLRKLGADVVAVDNKGEFDKTMTNSRSLIADIIIMDAIDYVRSGKANRTALFFCYPRMKSCGGEWVEECLKSYEGNDIFYVGELDRGCTFEIDEWLRVTGSDWGWHMLNKQVLPAFSGARDEFIHLKKY